MSTTENMTVKVGSRKSELALIQTRHVISLLKELYPECNFKIVTMTTLGDRILNISLPKIGEKSLFTKDLEEALENGSVDFVVHSLKDLPTALPKGMCIGAVLEREDPRDALVLRKDQKGHSLATLPHGSVIGTSSLRRTAQLSRYPHLKVVDVRGNLNTRLKKLDYHCKVDNKISKCPFLNKNLNPNDDDKPKDDAQNPEYTGLVLAHAGLVRMGWHSRISQVLSCDEVLYAVGQGALAIECKANNKKILEMLGPLNHEETYCRILSERSFLKTLGGGCSAPVGISTAFTDCPDMKNTSKKTLNITGAVWSLDGKIKIEDSMTHVFNHIIEPNSSKNNIEIKEKPIKHKLSDNGNDANIDECDASVCPKKMCPGIEANGNNVEKPSNVISCCKQLLMNKALGKAELAEIENLISAHCTLFLSCPLFSKKNFEVGSEVMGECPVPGNLKDELVKLHPRKSQYNIKECTFFMNQIAQNAQNDSASVYDLENNPKAKNCTFLLNLKDNIQSTSEKNGNTTESSEIISTENNIVEDDDVQLFCGLTKHFNLSLDIIEKCEDIGRELAQKLIDDGALDVMVCAQTSIRSSLPAVVTAL